MSANPKKSRSAGRAPGRRPLTRELLLPLGPARARALSLEHHLALVALRTGKPGVEVIARLFNAIEAARFLHEATHGRATPEQPRFEQAWHALIACANRLREGEPAAMSEADFACLEKLA
ncbi:hypothetical protein [Burkholderia territorii]|uniref:hypothetical protein n=1 Tax=Burkholderia territorii TaxID=1503055 RepID=UPI000A9E5DF0|nr:hypothetical protein [Burkholderia territorii]